jgi:hypothetical protein
MAIEQKIILTVDELNALGGLEKFQKGLVETETKTVSLKTELRQLKEQLSKLDEGTEQYDIIAKRAGVVADKITDINTEIKGLGSDTKGIDTVVQGAQALSGAFSIATSASVLLGVENEDLQKSMAKVEGAIGLTVGIQSIANALQKETLLYKSLDATATKIQTGLQLAYTAVIGGTTGALKVLKIALLTSGVGAIVVLLGYLIEKMTSAKESTFDLKSEQDKLNSSMERYNSILAFGLKLIDQQTKTNVLRAKIAGKSEDEIFKIEKDGQEKRILEYKQNLKNKEKLALDYSNNLTKKLSKLEGDARKEALAQDEKNIKEVENARTQYYDARQSNEDKRLENDLRLADDYREKQAKREDDARKLKEEADKKAQELEKQRLQDLADFKYLMLQAELENSINDRIQKKEEQDHTFDDVNADIARLDEADRIDKEKQIQREILVAEAKKNIQQATIATIEAGIGLLNKLAGKSKALQATALIAESAVGIAKIIISTQAANAADTLYAATLGPAGPAYKATKITLNKISAGIGIATNLVALKQGLSGLGASGGSGGGGSSTSVGGGSESGGNSSPPQFNLVAQNSNNQLAQSIANKQSQPVEAFVVSGNVTNSQELDRNRINTATFN